MPQISLATNERLFITGKTGSGKSYLARYLTRKISRLIVLDGKGTLGVPEWGLEDWYKSIDLNDQTKTFRLRAYPPLKADLVEFWDEILYQAMRAGNITIYMDELYAVVPPNKTASPTLFACYTRGREFGLGMWASTQRPVWIPLVAMSEAEHFFVFRLQLMEDKQRLAAFMGSDVLEPIRDDHGFYYMKAIDDHVTYYKQFHASDPVATAEEISIPPAALPQAERQRTRYITFGGEKV
jgi:energy-coupling factor transporter ATP-binding protein EcfA2